MGVPGEGLAGGKSGFRIGGVAKSTNMEPKSSKIGSGTPPGTKKEQKKKVTEKDKKVVHAAKNSKPLGPKRVQQSTEKL